MARIAAKHACPRHFGLVYRSGDPPETAWSGIPAGLARGLTELGFNCHFIDAEPLSWLTRVSKMWAAIGRGNRHGGMLAPEVRELRRMTARLRAIRVPPLDGVVQMGSDFGIPFSGRLVTYEDMTVPQVIRTEQVEAVLGPAAIERWIAVQARCYDAAINCCVASRWAADSIISNYGIDESKVHVVGFGRNHEPRPVSRDWTQPRFLFMGQDWERKNGPTVLRAFAQLKECVPAARLDVAGGHPRIQMSGVTTHGVLDLAESRDRTRAQALFENATCFVMPSRLEPFGMVYVEAAAAGVPSIGTTVGGARDAIGEEGGLLVDPSDERALTEAMAAMCDPSRASSMGAAALRRSQLFTWSAVAARVTRAFQFCCDRDVDPSEDL
jgi:glycosyltransferase involved in cell wall biosynthesis